MCVERPTQKRPNLFILALSASSDIVSNKIAKCLIRQALASILLKKANRVSIKAETSLHYPLGKRHSLPVSYALDELGGIYYVRLQMKKNVKKDQAIVVHLLMMSEEDNMTETISGLTLDYLQLLNNEQINEKYRNCLKELINNITVSNHDNIQAILLYGGVVRDSKVFDDWSDIDIIVVFKDIMKRSAVDLTKILQRLEAQYFIQIDLTQISLREVTDDRLTKCYLSSEVINTLSMTDNVSIVAFGDISIVSFTAEQEKQAAIFYIGNTLGLLRRYYVEVLYRGNVEDHIKADLRRIIRWVFSITRASLRLFNIYTHPYEDSLPYLKRIFPELDMSLLARLTGLRKNINALNDALEMIQVAQKIEIFIEEYVALCLGRYIDEIESNK